MLGELLWVEAGGKEQQSKKVLGEEVTKRVVIFWCCESTPKHGVCLLGPEAIFSL